MVSSICVCLGDVAPSQVRGLKFHWLEVSRFGLYFAPSQVRGLKLVGVVAGAEKIEDVQSRANAYVSLIKKSSESAVKEYTKAALDSTHVPGGETPKPDDNKSEAVKLAEQMASTRSDSIKTAQTSLDYYGGTNK